MRIFPITAPEFFIRDSPTSSIANPACMNRTRVAPTKTRSVLIAMSWSVGASLREGECRNQQQHHRRKHRNQPE